MHKILHVIANYLEPVVEVVASFYLLNFVGQRIHAYVSFFILKLIAYSMHYYFIIHLYFALICGVLKLAADETLLFLKNYCGCKLLIFSSVFDLLS